MRLQKSLSETLWECGKKDPKKEYVSFSQYLHFLTDINRESTKTLCDGLYPFYVKCNLGKEHQTDWNRHMSTPPTPFPTRPLSSLRGSLLYLQMNQSVSQRWAVCLHKHRLLTSQRTNKETNKQQKKKTKTERKSNQGKRNFNLKIRKSTVMHTKVKQ